MHAELKIDLANLAENYRRLKRKGTASGKAVEAAAVVKADAYGLGAVPVAKRLLTEGCRTFFVAYLNEGVHLRAEIKDPSTRIFVLGGVFEGEQNTFLERGLSPVLNSREQVALWAKVKTGKAAALHLDTGMSRLGIEPENHKHLPSLVDTLKAANGKPLIMTHLCSAEDKAAASNTMQLQRFVSATQGLADCEKSFANSSGIFLGEETHFDLLRPGVALYGGNPTPDHPNPMQRVVDLSLPVIQMRQIPKGASAGYNCTWTATRESWIATVQAGYADGLLRSLSGNAKLYFEGQAAPVVGRVSMDALTVDVTDLKHIPSVGEFMEMLGQNQSVDDLAASGGTIGYEILTALGSRYQRSYLA